MLDTNILISMIFFPSMQTRELYTPKILKTNEVLEMRDEQDIPILATAILENIDVFIMGDKDFLVLDVEIPEILTMREFLEKY